MKKRGFNRRFSKLSDFIRIKDIKNFLEEQVPLVDIPDKCLGLNSFNLCVFSCRDYTLLFLRFTYFQLLLTAIEILV